MPNDTNIQTYAGYACFIIAFLIFGFNLLKNYTKKLLPYQLVKKKENSMDLIGKKIVVKIGGDPPSKDEIVGKESETIVHVPEDQIGKHKNIIGEKIELNIGNNNKKPE